jgi:hypothetical protein
MPDTVRTVLEMMMCSSLRVARIVVAALVLAALEQVLAPEGGFELELMVAQWFAQNPQAGSIPIGSWKCCCCGLVSAQLPPWWSVALVPTLQALCALVLRHSRIRSPSARFGR